MSTRPQPAKTCVICGEDCSNRPRVKDKKGHYYCKDCHEKASRAQEGQSHSPAAEPAPAQAAEPLDEYGLLDEAIAETAQPESAPASPDRRVTAGPVAPDLPRGERAATARGGVGFLTSPTGAGLTALVVIPAIALIVGNLVTAAFFFFVILAALNGYWIGASKIAAALAGMFVAAVLAVPLGKTFEGLFSAALGSTGLANRMISIGVLAVICVAVVAVLLQFGIGRVFKKNPTWKRYDKLTGSGLGLLEGILLSFLLIWSVLSLEPVAVTSRAQVQEDGQTAPNPVSQGIVALAEVARDSTVGQIADAINPLEEMRLITLFENGLIVLNDAGTREAFVNHEVIEGIRERPSVRQALDMLADDAEMSEIIESEGGISRAELRTILMSPTILAILDETDLVDDLSPVADDLELAIEQALERTQPTKAPMESVPDSLALLTEALEDRDPSIRRRAANTLASLGPEGAAAVGPLVGALDDESSSVRAAVARALGRIGPPAAAAIPALTDRLQDQDATVRREAADAIARIQPEQR